MTFSRSLPKFVMPLVLVRENVQLDKIEIALGDWVIHGRRDHVSNALQSIATAQYLNPAWPEGHIFQAGTISTTEKSRLKFRGTGTGRGTAGRPRLLFSGNLETQPFAIPPTRGERSSEAGQSNSGHNSSQYSQNDIIAVRLRLELNLNLIRYIQAQPLLSGRKVKLGSRAGEPVLAISPPADFGTDERPLVFDTNVVLGGLARERFSKMKSWAGHLDEFFSTLLNFFESNFIDAAEENHCVLQKREYLSLRKLEACWEFQTENPIDQVISFGHALERISPASDVRTLNLDSVTSDTRGMSRRFAVDLGNTCRLRIYPKTINRIRLEVVHNARSLTLILQRRTFSGSDQLTQLVRWIETIILSSIEEATPRLVAAGAVARPAVGLLSPHRLVHRICSVVADRDASGAILDVLVREGCIRLNDLNPFAKDVVKLTRAGVLQPAKGKGRVWVVTSRYENALEGLK